jgi:hypothetical protein
MKTFVKENWYKLMIASSFLILSVGFFIYAVSPAYANTEKTNLNTKPTTIMGDATAVVSNGNLYYWDSSDYAYYWVGGSTSMTHLPKKRKLPL